MRKVYSLSRFLGDRMSNKMRKPPSMPHWYWRDLDGCWFCKNYANCHNCSVMKSIEKNIFPRKRKVKILVIRKEWHIIDFG